MGSSASQDGAAKSPREIDIQFPLSIKDPRDEESVNAADSPTRSNLVARSFNYEQQYDKKGYPENLSSGALKRRWRHAVNDLLSTVGVCVAKGRETLPSSGAYESAWTLDVRLENNYGILISAADALLRFGTEYWPLALRQRLQVSSGSNTPRRFRV